MCQQVASDDYPMLVQKYTHLFESQHDSFLALDSQAQCSKTFNDFGFWFIGFRCLHVVILFMCAFAAKEAWEKKTKRTSSVKVYGLNLFGQSFPIITSYIVMAGLESALILVSIRFMMSVVWEQVTFDLESNRYMWIGSITLFLQIAINLYLARSALFTTASTNGKAHLIPLHVERTGNNCRQQE